MKVSFKIFVSSVLIAAICGCSTIQSTFTQPTTYAWGTYPELTFGLTLDDISKEAYLDSLLKGLGGEEKNPSVLSFNPTANFGAAEIPPGYNAEVGTAYLNLGNKQKAHEFYKQERDAWPESQYFMDSLLGKKPSQKKPNKTIRSILVMPVLDFSNRPNARSLVESWISWPLAEIGYYVFPINTVKTYLKNNQVQLGDMDEATNIKELAKMFGADSVLVTGIMAADGYMGIGASSKVALGVRYYDAHGKLIFSDSIAGDHGVLGVINPANSNAVMTSLISSAFVAAYGRYSDQNLRIATMRVTTELLKKFNPGPYASDNPNEYQSTLDNITANLSLKAIF